MKSVLIVDDSPTIRSIVQVFLQGMGCSFVEAGDGLAALEVVKTGVADLAIIDLHMPNMDGLAFARALRLSAGELKDLPIILLTSDKSPELGAVARREGINAVLYKPITSSQLRSVVAPFVGGKVA